MNEKTENKNVKKWLITIGLVAALMLFTVVGVVSVNMIHRSKDLDLTEPFDISEEMYGTKEASLDKAPAYASGLCTSPNESVYLEGVELSSRAYAGLFHVEKGEIIYAQGIYEKIYPASITKIMTAIVAMKYGNMDDMVTVPEEAVNLEEGSTEIGFMPGDTLTMRELFHGLLIYSGNDAAMSIAKHVGGTVEEFVEMMNREAALLGATGTHFMNPTGLHDENHYTTVYDIYLMLSEALKYDEFVSVIQLGSYNMTYYHGEEAVTKHLDATDQYLTKQITPPKHVTVLGGKTGTTNQAGACLALVSQNAYGEPFISIITHAPTKSILYDNMNQLLSKIN